MKEAAEDYALIYQVADMSQSFLIHAVLFKELRYILAEHIISGRRKDGQALSCCYRKGQV